MPDLFLDFVVNLPLLSELLCLIEPSIVVDLPLVLLVDLDGEIGEKIGVNRRAGDHDETVNEPFRICGWYYITVAKACHGCYNKELSFDVFIEFAHLILVETRHCEPSTVLINLEAGDEKPDTSYEVCGQEKIVHYHESLHEGLSA